jgi:heat shock protein HtpX
MKAVQGMKAFFLNDPSQAMNEIHELSELDLDHSGTITSAELSMLKGKEIRLNAQDKLMELLSTHPNMLKRIKQLSTYA